MSENGDVDVPEPNFEDYDDFYDMLNINENVSVDDVNALCRKLLARYHPDKSNKPDARDIYKKINKSKDVLGNKGQRRIYDKLGHDEYMNERKESGREQILNKYSNDISELRTEEDEDRKPKQQTQSVTESSDSSEDDKELLDDLEAKKKIQDIYKKSWIAKLVSIPVLILPIVFSVIFFEQQYNSLVTSLNSYINVFSLPVVTLLIATIVGLLASVISGVVPQWLLRDIENNIEYKDTVLDSFVSDNDAFERNDVMKNQEASDDGVGRNISKQAEDWDDTEEYTDDKDTKVIRYNWSFKNGQRLLLFGLITSVIFSFSNGSHPMLYTYSLFTGQNEDFILDFGSEGVLEIVKLVNGTIGMVLLSSFLFGLVFTSHGISKEVWYISYFTDDSINTSVWDSIIYILGYTFVLTLVLGSTEIASLTGVTNIGVIGNIVFPTEVFTVLNITAILIWMFVIVSLLANKVINGNFIYKKKDVY